MTWEEIKEKYQHCNVGLSDVIYVDNSGVIKSACVLCTDKDIDRNKMILQVIQGKLIVRYTTFDEDGLNI